MKSDNRSKIVIKFLIPDKQFPFKIILYITFFIKQFIVNLNTEINTQYFRSSNSNSSLIIIIK